MAPFIHTQQPKTGDFAISQFIRTPIKAALMTFAALAASSLAPCRAWSPRVHQLQTQMAKGLVPVAMARYMDQHAKALLDAGGGSGLSVVSTPEDVEAQFHKVLEISEEGRPAREIVRELGRLANMVQLLTDPSAIGGFSAVRRTFSEYADEHFKKLTAVREPLFAAKGDLSPRRALQAWGRAKYERYGLLANHINPSTGARVGTWDMLSVPFAQMQLGFSTGVNATANLWILAWRAVGGLWLSKE